MISVFSNTFVIKKYGGFSLCCAKSVHYDVVKMLNKIDF